MFLSFFVNSLTFSCQIRIDMTNMKLFFEELLKNSGAAYNFFVWKIYLRYHHCEIIVLDSFTSLIWTNEFFEQNSDTEDQQKS